MRLQNKATSILHILELQKRFRKYYHFELCASVSESQYTTDQLFHSKIESGSECTQNEKYTKFPVTEM